MKALVLFAPGFEEIEAVTPVDVLRRAGLSVDMVGLHGLEVKGAHQILLTMDKCLDDVINDDVDLLILPGGLPGAHHLRDDQRVISLVRRLHEQGKILAAICAAPIILEKAGVLKGCRVTAYPSKEEELSSASYCGSRVEVDANIVTAKGAGCSMEFALALLNKMGLEANAKEISTAMFA